MLKSSPDSSFIGCHNSLKEKNEKIKPPMLICLKPVACYWWHPSQIAMSSTGEECLLAAPPRTLQPALPLGVIWTTKASPDSHLFLRPLMSSAQLILREGTTTTANVVCRLQHHSAPLSTTDSLQFIEPVCTIYMSKFDRCENLLPVMMFLWQKLGRVILGVGLTPTPL